MSKGVIPPQAPKSETAVLGAVMANEEVIPSVIQRLRPHDFYKPANQIIYESILALFERGEPIDIISLTNELNKTKNLGTCGGTEYLSSLTENLTSANIEYYADKVKNTSQRRQVIKVAKHMEQEANDPGRDVPEILDDVERTVSLLSHIDIGGYRSAGNALRDVIKAAEEASLSNSPFTGVPSGYHQLDSITGGFQPSEVTIIGARPSIGKTALAISMISNMAIRAKNKIPVGLFTLEMNSFSVMQRLIAAEGGIDSNKIRSGHISESDWALITKAAGEIYNAPIYIDDTSSISLIDLRAQSRRMKIRDGVQIIFIDYITLVTTEYKRNFPRHEQVAEISRSIKHLARELNIPIVALSQIRRETEGRRPNLSDIRESGSIEQDADVVMFIHREEQGRNGRGSDGPNEQWWKQDQERQAPPPPRNHNEPIETELLIAKNRNGAIEDLKLVFTPSTVRYDEPSSSPT